MTAEAGRNPAFCVKSREGTERGLRQLEPGQVKRPHRRAPGVVDPFAVFADGGEEGVRRSLSQLWIEQLKDVVAEQCSGPVEAAR